MPATLILVSTLLTIGWLQTAAAEADAARGLLAVTAVERSDVVGDSLGLSSSAGPYQKGSFEEGNADAPSIGVLATLAATFAGAVAVGLGALAFYWRTGRRRQ